MASDKYINARIPDHFNTKIEKYIEKKQTEIQKKSSPSKITKSTLACQAIEKMIDEDSYVI